MGLYFPDLRDHLEWTELPVCPVLLVLLVLLGLRVHQDREERRVTAASSVFQEQQEKRVLRATQENKAHQD